MDVKKNEMNVFNTSRIKLNFFIKIIIRQIFIHIPFRIIQNTFLN